jgi:nicotinate-nucleotide adenylyltransferase
LGLEKIIFVPAFIAPHKVGLEFAPAADRYRMTELATEPFPYFEVTDIELQRSGVSYTYDTVMELKARYPEYELYFIIGADAVPMLNTWHRIRELLAEVTFIAADRPGYGQTIDKVCEFFGEPAKNKIILLDTPEVDISSTGIRERVRRGLSIKGLVPESVEKYILEEHLYQS